jgi:DNA-binding transcriptional MerR regulator
MNAGEIMQQVEGLTLDKLTYFVRAGYVKPEKIKRGSLYYNDFSQRHLEIIKRAWKHISTFDMKTRSAFERAKKEIKDTQIRLPFK